MRKAIAATIATVGLMTACGSQGPEAEEPRNSPSGTLPGPFTSADEIKLPLADYLLSGPELREVGRARNAALDECVQRFTQTRYVPDAAVGVAPAFSNHRFGLVGTRTADEFGYHDPSDELSASFARHHPVLVPRGRPTAKYLLDGDLPAGKPRPADPGGNPLPAKGCASAAEKELGGPTAQRDFVRREIERIELDERGDPRVAEAIDDWSRCMSERGLENENPLDPVAEFGAAESVTSRELEVARADASCRVETSYVERRVQILTELQSASLGDHPDEWEEHRSSLTMQLRRARGYLELGGLSGAVEGEADGLSGPGSP